MSIMVDERGCAMTYAVVDLDARTILAGCNTFQQAHKMAASLGTNVVSHNVTHSKCPAWITDLIMADAAYCQARAALNQARSDRLRREAAALLEEADRVQAIADRYTQAAKIAAAAK
mgnify:FL=1